MNESQLMSIIRRVVRQELSAVLLGKVTSNESQTRLSMQHFSTAAGLQNIRSIQPFGVSSRAPVGTPVVTAPVNHDHTHIISLGNFDENRPTTNDGETILYDAYGHIVYLSETKMQFGSKTSAENMVLGQVFKAPMSSTLQDIAVHKHIGNMGYLTSPPDNAADFEALKASPVDDEGVLSDIAFTQKVL